MLPNTVTKYSGTPDEKLPTKSRKKSESDIDNHVYILALQKNRKKIKQIAQNLFLIIHVHKHAKACVNYQSSLM